MHTIPFHGAASRRTETGCDLILHTGAEMETELAKLVFEANKLPMMVAEIGALDGKNEKRRRSLDANAYAWVLIDKLAVKMGRKKEDVYRDEIANIGGNCDTVCVPAKAVDKLCRNWGTGHVGWITTTAESKLPGCVNVTLYYGSSTFDASQMHRFIDNIIQDCRAVEIETLPPEKLQMLMEEWSK